MTKSNPLSVPAIIYQFHVDPRLERQVKRTTKTLFSTPQMYMSGSAMLNFDVIEDIQADVSER